MTANHVPVDDSAVLKRILTDANTLLLDFDGPICSIFDGIPAGHIAGLLRQKLLHDHHADLPASVKNTDDPFDVLHYAVATGRNLGNEIEAALTDYEIKAVETARPTPGAVDLIRTWHAIGRTVAVVSNNSSAAIKHYLGLNNLLPYVSKVSARRSADTSILKPSPDLVRYAIETTGGSHETSVLIGDSAADIQAARANAVRCIAFANKPYKLETLRQESPDLLVSRLPSRHDVLLLLTF